MFYTNNISDSNRFEIRPFQGFSLAWPNRPLIVLKHYLRLEERFDMETGSRENTFGLRFRYQADLTLWFSGKYIKFNKNLYVPASIELFWNLIGTKQFSDAARINLGIGYKFSEKWKGDIQFGYHYTRNTMEDNFATNDLVFRLRAIINLKKIKGIIKIKNNDIIKKVNEKGKWFITN